MFEFFLHPLNLADAKIAASETTIFNAQATARGLCQGIVGTSTWPLWHSTGTRWSFSTGRRRNPAPPFGGRHFHSLPSVPTSSPSPGTVACGSLLPQSYGSTVVDRSMMQSQTVQLKKRQSGCDDQWRDSRPPADAKRRSSSSTMVHCLPGNALHSSRNSSGLPMQAAIKKNVSNFWTVPPRPQPPRGGSAGRGWASL